MPSLAQACFISLRVAPCFALPPRSTSIRTFRTPVLPQRVKVAAAYSDVCMHPFMSTRFVRPTFKALSDIKASNCMSAHKYAVFIR